MTHLNTLNKSSKAYLKKLVRNSIIPQDLLDAIVSTNDINTHNEQGVGLVQYVCSNGTKQDLQILIKHGLDINQLDCNSNSALHVAILSKNKTLINFLLQAMSGENVLQTDCDGMNPLHLAIQLKDERALKTIMKDQRFIPSLASKDIYGRTALDIAANAKWDKGIKVLLNSNDIEVENIPGYGNTFYDLSQHHLEKKLGIFLGKKGQSALNKRGNCHGWSFLYLVYLTADKEQEFFDILTLLKKWNGNRQFLKEPKNLSLSLRKLYKTPEDVFNQLANDLAVFHGDSPALSDLQLNISQRDRIKQYDLIKDISHKNGRQLQHLFGYTRLSLNRAQLIEMLTFFQRWPQTAIDIYLPEHTVTMYITKDAKFKYFNSNAKNKMKVYDSPAALADHLIKSVYLKDELQRIEDNFDIGFDAYKFYSNINKDAKKEKAAKGHPHHHTSANSFTPLHYAVMENDIEKVRTLLKDASPQALKREDKQGFNPIIRAIHLQFEEVFLDLLKSFTAEKNTKDIQDLSSIKITNYCSNKEMAFLAKLVCKAKLHPHAQIDSQGGTILSHALSYGVDIGLQMRLLKTPGVDMHRVDHSQKTLLHHAVSNSADLKIIEAIASTKGFDIDKQDNDGHTALAIAIMDEKQDIVKVLLDKGADAHKRNRRGQTPFDIALKMGNKAVQALLNPKPPLLFSNTKPRPQTASGKNKQTGKNMAHYFLPDKKSTFR